MDIAYTHFFLVQKYLKAGIYLNHQNKEHEVVFKTPADNRTDYIKRLIGLPGDRIQFVNGKF